MTVSQAITTPGGLEKMTVAYRNVDGHEILADVYCGKGNQVRPMIVYIHGGGLIVGNREMATSEYDHLEIQLLSLAEKKNYAVISIDYRLAPETKLPEIVSDLEAAFSWLGGDGAKRFRLDPERMVVAGFGSAGYLVLLSGYRVNPRPKALVALCPFGELNADWYTKPSPDPKYRAQIVSREEAVQQTDGTVVSDGARRKGDGWKIYLHYRQNGLWPQEVSGFSPESFARNITPYEPVRNVTRQYPPTLLIHGTQDTDHPIEESQKLSAQFNTHGVPHIFTPIENADHGFIGGDPVQIQNAYSTMHEFLLRYLEAKETHLNVLQDRL